VVENIYEGLIISVKSICEETEDFGVRVGVHQVSALSPYLLSVVMDELQKRYKRWYHGASILVEENREEVNQMLVV